MMDVARIELATPAMSRQTFRSFSAEKQFFAWLYDK
jgi:hypothetical protein